MTDEIKHECGIALIRLLKPLEYYQLKYGTWRWGLNKLYLLMEKQHNRGQDGAGIACVKFDIQPGYEYLDRIRSISSSAINDLFQQLRTKYADAEKVSAGIIKDIAWSKKICLSVVKFYWGIFATGLMERIILKMHTRF